MKQTFEELLDNPNEMSRCSVYPSLSQKELMSEIQVDSKVKIIRC